MYGCGLILDIVFELYMMILSKLCAFKPHKYNEVMSVNKI